MPESYLLKPHWKKIIQQALEQSRCLCVMVFGLPEWQLLYANQAAEVLLKGQGAAALINPGIEQLSGWNSSGEIFKGYLTLGDNRSSNITISAVAIRKGREVLIFGEAELHKMLETNTKMAQLNQEISNLQRKLIKEKSLLASTMEKLKTNNEQLAILNQEKNRFMGMAAHDLRSPISTAISYADVMQNDFFGISDEKKQEFLAVIEERLRFSIRLMSELLDFSKIESGSLGMKPGHHNYAELVRKTATFHEMAGRWKGIRFILELPEQDPEFLFDMQKMEQVLSNLMSNGVKYSHPNSTVIIRLKSEGHELLTQVADTGPGIEQSELPFIFDPFQKSSTRPTAGEPSTGLGLAISRKIIEEHGGRIFAESKPGKGSVFSFTLPIIQTSGVPEKIKD